MALYKSDYYYYYYYYATLAEQQEYGWVGFKTKPADFG